MRVLVVGAYGFIGRAIVGALLQRGHFVVGLGRSARTGKRLLPRIDWVERDLNTMVEAANWHPLLDGVDAVVNASGALQDDRRDRLVQSQSAAIVALIDACAQTGVKRFVQISAAGATEDASTGFLRTKAVADGHLASSSLAWTILRPALVTGRDAYGGTALIRMLAASPVMLTVHGRRPVQCVSRATVAELAADAIEGRIGPRLDAEIAEREARPLGEVVALHRSALGMRPAWFAVDLPPGLARPIGWFADALGWLGWRSPLRSTALKVVAEGVVANGASEAILGRPIEPLPAILDGLGFGPQDRWAARLALLLPFIVASLAALWIASGITGFTETDRAAALIGGGERARLIVRACALLDLIVGFAILWRPWARGAALAMAAMAGGYLIGGSVAVPALLTDPLMPLLKSLPALVLALVAASLLEER